MGRDYRAVQPQRRHAISIHAPRVGRDVSCNAANYRAGHFNPRAPCGARRQQPSSIQDCVYISIHAPRVGRDPCRVQARHPRRISIHAPRVGRDWRQRGRASGLGRNFNPRAPCGARPEMAAKNTVEEDISIHAPRVGRDIFVTREECNDSTFQSTRPVWGATVITSALVIADVISIHAPRVGRDLHGASTWDEIVPISIHAPRVGRDRARHVLTARARAFQSTRPVWGATSCGKRLV